MGKQSAHGQKSKFGPASLLKLVTHGEGKATRPKDTVSHVDLSICRLQLRIRSTMSEAEDLDLAMADSLAPLVGNLGVDIAGSITEQSS